MSRAQAEPGDWGRVDSHEAGKQGWAEGLGPCQGTWGEQVSSGPLRMDRRRRGQAWGETGTRVHGDRTSPEPVRMERKEAERVREQEGKA